MSYHVTILRTQNRKQIPITRDEVEAAMRARPDLETRSTPGGVIEIWIRALGDSSPLLVWQDGEIWTKSPDDSTLALMLDLAGALRACEETPSQALSALRAAKKM